MNRANDLRERASCPGCGGEKQSGCLVCWGCFKSGTGGFEVHAGITVPFKYFPSTETEDEVTHVNRWLKEIGRETV